MDKSILEHVVPETKQNVVSEIVAHGLCSGCGVCAGTCPSKILRMRKQKNGDLAPILFGDCPAKCTLCLKVCPFSNGVLNVSELAQRRFNHSSIHNHEAVGFYLANYVGYSNAHRANGASGGMATWMLETLLTTGLVDAVIVVSSGKIADDPDGRLFHMREMTTVEEIRAASRSVYYPVSIDEPLRSIQDLKGSKRYAIVGLPCVLKGIALAMSLLPALRRSIRFTFGLVCGHLPNFYYTDYLTALSGHSPNEIDTVIYRGKSAKFSAGNFYFQSIKQSIGGKKLHFSKIAPTWGNRLFQLNACNYCDDLFAEVADASFMDAWLPEYSCDYRGHSIVTIRNSEILSIVNNGIVTGTCNLQQIAVEKVVLSQKSNWDNKTRRLRAYLTHAATKNKHTTATRQQSNWKDYRIFYFEIMAQNWLQDVSKQQWPILGHDVHSFERKIALVMFAASVFGKVRAAIINPGIVSTKLSTKLKSVWKRLRVLA